MAKKSPKRTQRMQVPTAERHPLDLPDYVLADAEAWADSIDVDYLPTELGLPFLRNPDAARADLRGVEG